MDDASTELMMADSGDKVMLLSGEAFFETNESDATEYCDYQVEIMQSKLQTLQSEQESILSEQTSLKKILYGRFGKSINLEEG